MKGQGDKYSFYYSSNKPCLGGAGVRLAVTWNVAVIEMQRFSDSIILLKFMSGSRVLTSVSVYAQQDSLLAAFNELFFDQLHFASAEIPDFEY